MIGNHDWSGGSRKLDANDAPPAIDDVCCERMSMQLQQRCDQHESRYDCPDSIVNRVRGGYGLIVLGSDSVIEIAFCPWCGARLPLIEDLDLSIGVTDV